MPEKQSCSATVLAGWLAGWNLHPPRCRFFKCSGGWNPPYVLGFSGFIGGVPPTCSQAPICCLQLGHKSGRSLTGRPRWLPPRTGRGWAALGSEILKTHPKISPLPSLFVEITERFPRMSSRANAFEPTSRVKSSKCAKTLDFGSKTIDLDTLNSPPSPKT